MTNGQGTTVHRGWLARLVGRIVAALARRVGDARAVLALVLMAGASVLAAGTIFFAWLASEVGDGETLGVDRAILRWMGAHGSHALTEAALNATALGSGMVVWLMTAVAAAFLWGSRHRWSAALLVASVAGAALVNVVLKSLFERPRPDVFPWRTPHAAFSSFPSGHSMTAMVAYSTLAYLVIRLEPRRALRRLTLFVCLLVITAVGTSRVYLGVHYPSDVLGGFVAGLAWASFCALAMEALRLLRRQEPAVARAEHGVEAGAGTAETAGIGD